MRIILLAPAAILVTLVMNPVFPAAELPPRRREQPLQTASSITTPRRGTLTVLLKSRPKFLLVAREDVSI
jgi:hypothetical protein